MLQNRRKFLEYLILSGCLGYQEIDLYAQAISNNAESKLKRAKIIIVGGGFGGTATC
jgi:molybdopterin-biosynthesis enzyme MoeA-like protein